MAKKAAPEAILGDLHMKVANIFIRVLDVYDTRMDVVDTYAAKEDDPDVGVLKLLFDDGALPSPAMLSGITKFLKDNDIGFDTEEVQKLNDQERRLAERREKRSNVVALTDLSHVKYG